MFKNTTVVGVLDFRIKNEREAPVINGFRSGVLETDLHICVSGPTGMGYYFSIITLALVTPEFFGRQESLVFI